MLVAGISLIYQYCFSFHQTAALLLSNAWLINGMNWAWNDSEGESVIGAETGIINVTSQWALWRL